jgi:hypothetical protein
MKRRPDNAMLRFYRLFLVPCRESLGPEHKSFVFIFPSKAFADLTFGIDSPDVALMVYFDASYVQLEGRLQCLHYSCIDRLA